MSVTSGNLPETSYAYNVIRSYLKRIVIKFKLLIFSEACFLWLSITSLLILMRAFMTVFLRLQVNLAVIWLLVFSVATLFLLVRPLRNRMTIEKTAFRIDQLHPEFQDIFISAVQLQKHLKDNKYGYSESFIRSIISRAHSLLKDVDSRKVLSPEISRFKRSIAVMLLCLFPTLIIAVTSPSILISSLEGLVFPVARSATEDSGEIFRISPGNCSILPGSDVRIVVETNGFHSSIPALHYRQSNDTWKEMQMENISSNSFLSELKNIGHDMEYYVTLEDQSSQRYLIRVIERPVIGNLRLELHYPGYMGLQPQLLGLNVGNVSAPIGTKVVISAESSKDLVSSFLVLDYGERIKLKVVDGKKIEGSFVVKKDGSYHISAKDSDGQSNADSITYFIKAIPDMPPRVKIVIPGKNIDLDRDMKVLIQIDSQDDYGVSKLSLRYHVQDQKEEEIQLISYDSAQTDVSFKYLWDLSSLGLFPEDVVSYYACAYDFNNVSGPNIGRSDVFTIRYPSLYEIFKKADEEQQKQVKQMEELLSDQDEAKKAVDNILKELKAKDELDWTSKKELERVESVQKKLEEQVKELSKQLDQTLQKLEENSLVTGEMLKKIREIKELLDEIATDEMKQIMQKLSQTLSSTPIKEKDLIDLAQRQKELMEQLDRIINLFKNMRLEQRLEAISNQLKELVKKQDQLISETESLKKEDVQMAGNLSVREMRMKGQVEQIHNDLDSAAYEAKSSAPNVAKLIDQVNEDAKKSKIAELMQKASSDLKAGNISSSLEYQKGARSGLSEFSEELQSLLDAMKSQDAREIINALHDAIRKGLYVSHKLEDTAELVTKMPDNTYELTPKEKQQMDAIAADQLALANGLRKVAEGLKEVGKKSPLISAELIRDIETTANGMNRSAKVLEDKMSSLAVPILKSNLAMINRAIKGMLDNIEQIESQATPMMSFEDYMQQLRQLAEQQSRLNESTRQAEGQMRRQGITRSLEELLERLSAEQSMIKEAVERLSKKLDQLSASMGNLKEVAREMEDVAEDLRRKFVSRNTLEKQQRILNRLLDYEKSLKRQDFDRKRQAEVARDYTVERPNDKLPEDALKIKKQIETMLSPSLRERWPKQYSELIRMYYKALSNTLKSAE